MVQVENSISRVELGERMKTIADKWAELTGAALPEHAFGHAFGDDGDLPTGDMKLMKVAAEQIEADTWIRVIFFKEALTTGWDCPRAEVMVSLRPAKDATTIAQLVGRMIRTPGATHAPDPRLESVMLYLPYYSQAEVRKVVKEIAVDSEGAPVVELSSEPTEPNPLVSDDVFNKINGLPKYTKPKRDYPDDVERAAHLAERLVDKGIVTVKGGEDTPEDVLRDLLVAEIKRLAGANKKQVDQRVKDLLEIDTHRRDFKYAGADNDDDGDEGTGSTKKVHFRDLDGYFENAKRRLPGGTGSWYYESLIDGGVQGKKAKMRVAAVAEIADVKDSLNQVAINQIEAQSKEHGDRVETQGMGEQFKAIWYPAEKPVDGTLVLANPGRVATQQARKKGNEIEYVDFPLLGNHVWAFEKGANWVYPGSSNTWEDAALNLELDPSRKVVGWYRNPNSGKSALSIPYEKNGTLALLHPDFIFVREIDGDLVVDIVDPHLDHGDSREKWRGMAWYAAEHSEIIRRAIAVVRIGETDWGLDVAKPDVREALEDTEETLESIFQRFGAKRIQG